jgi:hypothetical protein
MNNAIKCESCGTIGDDETECLTVCTVKYDHAHELLCDECAEALGYLFDWTDGAYYPPPAAPCQCCAH